MEKPYLNKFFDLALNRWFRSEMSLLFGNDYYVTIKYIKYSTNLRRYIIDCKLMIKDPTLCVDTYPSGLEMVVSDVWQVLLMNETSIILSSTIDLIED
jgi:hypothetical protein